MLGHYLRENVLDGLRVPPWRAPVRAWLPVPIFAVIALMVGFETGLLRLRLISDPWAPVLPVTLLVFPALFEEALFRGLLMPRQFLNRGGAATALTIGGSTLLYVAWHPLNAWLFTPSARTLFYDPAFLFIVGALGIACGYSYAVSRSLWAPTLIHWATVLIWVFFLGGRNLLLEI